MLQNDNCHFFGRIIKAHVLVTIYPTYLLDLLIKNPKLEHVQLMLIVRAMTHHLMTHSSLIWLGRARTQLTSLLNNYFDVLAIYSKSSPFYNRYNSINRFICLTLIEITAAVFYYS